MASSNTESAPPSPASSEAPGGEPSSTVSGRDHHGRSLSRGGSPRGGRGRGSRGGGDRGKWRGGRGRGQHTSIFNNDQATRQQESAPTPKVPDVTNTNVPGSANVDTTAGADEGDAATDDSICFICANPITCYSMGPCGHSTCHICSLRMRALYNTKACAHCRTEAEYVIFTANGEKKYEEYEANDIFKTDANLGIRYTSAAINEDTVLLLRYNCPDPTCDVQCIGWKGLHNHVKAAHNKILCRLCTYNKKVFTHEHALFTLTELRRHEKDGDDLPGTAEQSGFKGHPECGFCHERFYSSDELYQHCREAHETCFICERRSYSRNQQYYVNYDALAMHFQKEHFLCMEKECLEKRFVVFEEKEDYNAHQLDVHPNTLSKLEKRDARKVNINPTYEPHQLSRGRGRGRDPNLDLPPARSEQPLRRDELAFQRTLAVQSSQSTTTRAFGGQLTSQAAPNPIAGPSSAQSQRPTVSKPVSITPPLRPTVTPSSSASSAIGASEFPPLSGPAVQPPRPPVPPPQRPPVNPLGASQFPPLSGSAVQQSRPSASQARTSSGAQSADDQKKARHLAVIERANAMLKGDQRKLVSFRKLVSEYRTNIKSARGLCDAFWSLFEANATELGSLIRALAELYEDERKKTDLLAAWNSWRAVNADFPAIGGARVLKIKSATTPSARSARQGAWGSAAVAPSTSSTAAVNRVGNSAAKPSPWATTAGAQSAGPSRPIVTAVYQSNTARAKKAEVPGPSKTEFPALPQKPPMHNFGPVIRSGGRGAVVNAWTAGTQASRSGNSTGQGDNGDAGEASDGKKKKGKQKQTLFHFG